MSEVKHEYVPSVQQAAYYDFVQNGRGSAVVEAVAGAGKTETLARAVMMMQGYVTVMMFNKNASEEFKSRLVRLGGADQQGTRVMTRKGLVVGTCHSIGFSAFRGLERDADINERKVANIIEAMAADPAANFMKVQMLEDGGDFIKRTVSIAKQMLAGITFQVTDLEKWLKMVQHFSLDSDLADDADVPVLVQIAMEIFMISAERCRSTTNRRAEIDFDDMIWAPLYFKARFFTVDHVVIDEAQDTNPARRELAARCLKPGGRLHACGDSRQAIYGFTGADHNALDLITKRFNAVRMPLTVTYRCPKSVVRHAHQWVNHIEAHNSAPEGQVRAVILDKEAKPRPWFVSDPLGPTDAVICRYNKPLVKLAFTLIKSGIACKVEGRDIGMGLIVLVNRLKAKTLDGLEPKLEKWRAKEISKARAKKSESLEQAVSDKADCILVFIEACRAEGGDRTECVIAKISALFADDVKGILTLCSGHKSKGREWKNVFWVQTEQRGFRELQPHEQLQEDNIKYVITTRAQETLVLVPEKLV